MTRNEAIEKLKAAFTMCIFTDAYGDPIDSDEYYKALDMAIKALKEPEIVRCMNCEFATESKERLWCGGSAVSPYHFCGSGMRRQR